MPRPPSGSGTLARNSLFAVQNYGTRARNALTMPALPVLFLLKFRCLSGTRACNAKDWFASGRRVPLRYGSLAPSVDILVEARSRRLCVCLFVRVPTSPLRLRACCATAPSSSSCCCCCCCCCCCVARAHIFEGKHALQCLVPCGFRGEDEKPWTLSCEVSILCDERVCVCVSQGKQGQGQEPHCGQTHIFAHACLVEKSHKAK